MAVTAIGIDCKHPTGAFMPVIDRFRCEGERPRLPLQRVRDRQARRGRTREPSLIGRMKATVHGNRQAFAVRAEQCQGCGLCVAACPEKAIKLARVAMA